MKARIIITAVACVAFTACGDGGGSNGDNGSTNNGSTNNSTENNGTENNGTSNNSTANNGTSNNSTENNGANVECRPNFGEADACGGDETADWTVVEACSDFDYAALLEDACPDIEVSEPRYSLTGGLGTTGGLFAVSILGEVEADAMVPQSCAEQVGGCSGVEQALGLAGAQSADCTDSGGACDCTVVFEGDYGSSGGYETDGGVATVNDDEEWYYCVEGNTMTLRKAGDGSEDNPTFVLTK